MALFNIGLLYGTFYCFSMSKIQKQQKGPQTMKHIFYATAIVLFTTFWAGAFTFAATNNNNPEKKLRELKGDVQKIIVTTTDGELTFEGTDAEKLLKKMKRTSPFPFYGAFTFGDFDKHDFYSDDSCSNSPRKMNGFRNFTMPNFSINIDSILSNMKSNIYINKMNSEDSSGFAICDMVPFFGNANKSNTEIRIEDDGTKKVTITKHRGNKTIIKVLKGKDAEKYLEKNKEDSIEE